MTGGTAEMKDTPYEGYRGIRLPKEVQWRRVQAVIQEELTEKERQTLNAYYMEKKTLEQIAKGWGINKSTVWRNLKRAENKLRRFLKY